MSSGQKSWAEGLEEERQAEHYKRLENLGFCVIANTVDDGCDLGKEEKK